MNILNKNVTISLCFSEINSETENVKNVNITLAPYDENFNIIDNERRMINSSSLCLDSDVNLFITEVNAAIERLILSKENELWR